MDLYEACENGNEERVVELLVHGEHRIGRARGSRLINAIDAGESFSSRRHESTTLAANVAAKAGLVQTPLEMLRARGTAGRTPLHAAALGGQAGVVRLLLGEPCDVYFTSRSKDEVMELLEPLSQAGSTCHSTSIRMATKDDIAALVPMATIQFGPGRIVPVRDLLDGRRHVDVFGNTPLQCISCFGCGSTESHIADGLDITKQLLLHGDQPNLPKYATHWTPLHWSAYNGNHEQTALLLHPAASLPEAQRSAIGKTQISIPLLVNGDNLFAVDVAGRRGLTLVDEMAELRRKPKITRNLYERWRLRLNHVQVLQLFTREFLANAQQLSRYVAEMNSRVPTLLRGRRDDSTRKRAFTTADAVRYGQHLLYWMGCFGLVNEVRDLLAMELTVVDAQSHHSGATAQVVRLQPLYVCSCEEAKRQSVLHAVAVHGQEEIVRLLLERMLDEQHKDGVPLSHVKEVDNKPEEVPQHRRRSTIVPATEPLVNAKADNGGEHHEQQLQQHKPGPGLDILALLTSGWKNHRNETPLFLAALHLRQGVVRVIHALLTAESIAWELKHCNVEGSYIHHVAHDEARHLLGVSAPHVRHVCAEYVLLFDGQHRQFKETLIETLCEESAITPSLVVTRGGQRILPGRACGLFSAKQIDYLIVGATEDVLVRHAQALQLKVKHRGSKVRSTYTASAASTFEPFRSLQRQQVVLDVIQKNCNLHRHLRKRNVLAIFPLHDSSGCRNIVRHWVRGSRRRAIYQPFHRSSLRQFLTEKRTHQYEMLWPLLTYFGEKHAFYYAFTSFYTVWLSIIAVPGAALQVVLSITAVRVVAPVYAVFVALWATLLVERWKRKRSEIQSNFGVFKRNRNEEAPEFYGDFQVAAVEKPIIDIKFPRGKQLARIYAGVPVLLTMASLVVIIFVAVKTRTSTLALVGQWCPWMPAPLQPYVVPVLNAVSMLVLDNLYTRVALALTRWENHRTVWQYESMLAAKLFWFKFLNAFISLFWVAFIEQDADALRNQLIIIMGVRQLWYAFVRNIVPMLLVQARWKAAGFHVRATTGRSWCSWLSREWYDMELKTTDSGNKPAEPSLSSAPPPLVLVQELMQPPDFLMGKQMEVILQFGYITMFVSVLPVAPLLALLSNVLNTRLDVLTCTQVKKRPPFESETEVSTFMSILKFMSFAAVAVNCAVMFFTTPDGFGDVLSWAMTATGWGVAAELYVTRLWLLLVIEHVVLGLKALLSLTIEDSASWVQNDDDRKEEEAKNTEPATPRPPGSLEGSNQISSWTAESLSTTASLPAMVSATDDFQTVIDQLLADVGAKTPRGEQVLAVTNIQRALADKYAQALRERDAAIARERQLQDRLEECTEQLAQRDLQEPRAPARAVAVVEDEPFGDMDFGDECLPPTLDENEGDEQDNGEEGEARTSDGDDDGQQPKDDADIAATTQVANQLTKQIMPEAHPTHCCCVCSTLTGVLVLAAKRCLSCRRFLCAVCDDVVHLDDLGVKEPLHFRVQVTVDGSRSTASGREVAQIKSQNLCSEQELMELRTLLEWYDQMQNENLPTGKRYTIDELVVRCQSELMLLMRFLKNSQRRFQQQQQLASRRPSEWTRRLPPMIKGVGG
ncbi:TPA: hypothetical protein N0F65_009898 [Lagenidium giganteum]|uniref:Anoctamin transmembrane domain-containing protein n=1 Tax=Lagenidium giganteum TaxID=4803 RepID=A0AAV2YR13_9STRA|nr:TPA: hypothetical protein N0F65_009898 [Lagenidium giganteum]